MKRAALLSRVAALTLLTCALVVVVLSRTSGQRGQALAFTECTIRGPVLTLDASRIPPEDTLPVRMHEDVHVRQCHELGWMRMRWRNLTAGGRLSLEAPGYCAGARARLRRGDGYRVTRERLLDDANAMFAGVMDSAHVNAALRASCPELTASVVQ